MKIFLHWFDFLPFKEIIIYMILKILMGFWERMIITLQNDAKFAETGLSKEKLLT